MRLLPTFLIAIISFACGLALSTTDLGNDARTKLRTLKTSIGNTIAHNTDLEARQLILLEHPSLLKAVARGGAFGGDFSLAIAQGMFRKSGQGIEDAIKMMRIEEVAPRTWLIRLPIVNVVFFETDEGLVLVDTGMAPAGPAILKAIRQVSDKPLHTIIYTHGHVDHAYGTWALMEDKNNRNVQIIAQENLPARFQRYIRLRGSLAHYMDQPQADLPSSGEDLVWPTRTFDKQLTIQVGGETFVLQHHRAETDDQLYVWAPQRRILASADYYQGFLPNAGNGKRSQRYPEDWALALREMAELKPNILLPAHGAAIHNPQQIQENLQILAETLQFIVDHTVNELNKGTRKDVIPKQLQLPSHLANHASMKEQYVSPADISKMVIKRYTGWWDDIPSHWSPTPLATQGREIAILAGGIEQLVAHTRQLIDDDIQLACHLTDWAYLSYPERDDVQQLVIDTYKARILDSKSNTMEMLTYLNTMADARQRQLQNTAK